MIDRFFGGPPGPVLIRLIVLSIVAGVIMTAIGVSPFELVDSVRRLALRIYDMGFGAVEWIFRYFWLGAIVVIPIWAISRIWSVYAGAEDSAAAGPPTPETDRMADPPPGAGSN